MSLAFSMCIFCSFLTTYVCPPLYLAFCPVMRHLFTSQIILVLSFPVLPFHQLLIPGLQKPTQTVCLSCSLHFIAPFLFPIYLATLALTRLLWHHTWRPLHSPRSPPPSERGFYCPACWNSLLAVTPLPCFVVLRSAYCLVVYSVGVLFVSLVRRQAPWGQGLCLINHSILVHRGVKYFLNNWNFLFKWQRFNCPAFRFSAHYINIVGITSEGCLICLPVRADANECILSGVGGWWEQLFISELNK